MKKFILAISVTLLFLIPAGMNAGTAGGRKITPLLDSGRKMTLDGTWKFSLIAGKPVLPERFDEPRVVLDGCRGAADTVFFRPGFDTSSWSDITVPGCWDMQGFSEPTYGVVPSYTGLYKREFTIPSDWNGGHVFVRFGGVLYTYRFWVNGEEAGSWDNSNNGASFDISPFLRSGGKNEIAVRVDTRSPYYQLDKNDNWALCGIFRSVDLMWFPDTFIDDCYVHTKVSSPRKGLVEADIELDGGPVEGHSLHARLLSPSGKLVSSKSMKLTGRTATLRFPVSSPELWSAETPSLYTLDIELRSGSKTTQTLHKKVGIRELAVKDGVLLLNGSPIKLRGVNSHDLDPMTGKTLSLESMRRDVKMWKEGNINFVRGSHYAQDERKLELCDSVGIYVDCEVSFNFWRDCDTAHVDNLVSRGEATVLRDRSHPSVIIWSIGNEEPIYEGTVKVAERVRALDPTRLITYPGTEPESTLPPVADLYSPHYPGLSAVSSWKPSGRPLVATEYAHSLGLAFGSDFVKIWKTMFNTPEIAGGAVWHFQDQGILRESVLPVDRSALTSDVWIDPTHYYNASVEGCDGIVYADRTPQQDWWLVRDAYSPVQIIENRLEPAPGGEIRVHVCNQYDFLDLSAVRGRWSLRRNGREESSGEIALRCAPHDTVEAVFPVRMPEAPGNDVWTLYSEFSDYEGRDIYEHEICLTGDDVFKAIRDEIKSSLKGADGGPALDGRPCDAVRDLIPLVRTGRAPILADVTVRDKHFGGENYYWDPFLFKADNVVAQEENGATLVKATYWRNYPYVTEHLLADCRFTPLGSGAYDLDFNVVPVTTTGYFLDAGVSWMLPEEADVVQWLGDGPGAVYPDRGGNESPGIHRLVKGDLHFNGNRAGVRAAVVTGPSGTGLAILADGADIAFEVLGGRIVLSFNNLVSGVGHKKTMSPVNYPASKVGSFGGSLTVIPLKAGRWPPALQRLFGPAVPSRSPRNPFWHSYDTTR